MVLKRQILGEVTVPHALEKQGKCLGADEVRGDELMPRADRGIAGDDVQEGRSVDHVAGHVRKVGALAWKDTAPVRNRSRRSFCGQAPDDCAVLIWAGRDRVWFAEGACDGVEP